MSTDSTSKQSMSRRGVGVILLVALVALAGLVRWRLHSNPADAHIEAGNDFARQGDGSNAIHEWAAATTIDPDNPIPWQLLARSYFEARQWSNCRDALLQVVRLAPATAHAYSLLASCCRNLGDDEGAVRYAKEALQRDPNDIPAIEIATAIHMKRGDDAEAINGMQRLTVLQPDKVDNLIALVQLLMRENNVAEMLPVLDRILLRQPDNAEMYAMRGTARFYSDGTDAGQRRCEEDMVRAMSIKPTIYVAPLYLGRIYRRRGELVRAKQFFVRATRLEPSNAQAFFDLAGVEERLGDTAHAASDRHRFETLTSAAEQYTHLKKQCTVAAADFGLNLKVGELATKYGEFNWAIICLQRAHRLRPNDVRVTVDLKRLDARRHQLGSVREPSNGAFTADPEHFDSEHLMGGR